jgi:hypothetical protein
MGVEWKVVVWWCGGVDVKGKWGERKDYLLTGWDVCACSVYAKAARVSWPPSKIFGDELRIIGSFSEMHMFRESLFPLPFHGCPGLVCVSELTERNSSNGRVPRLGQDQDKGHRQQGVQAGAVWRGAREHPEQDGHQGSDCIRGLMCLSPFSIDLSGYIMRSPRSCISSTLSMASHNSVKTTGQDLINDSIQEHYQNRFTQTLLPVYIIAVCKCDRQPNRQKTCHAL